MAQRKHGISIIKYTLFFLFLTLLSVLFVVAFEYIPLENSTLAFDWRSLWVGLEHGDLKYHSGSGVRNPPWSMLFVLPLGLLSFRAGWALLSLLTLLILVLSVPRGGHKGLWGLSAILLLTSYPAIRHTADGNFEGLVIAGLLLVLAGYHREQPFLLAIGSLMASAKVQEVWLFFPILALYLLTTWPVRRWLVTATIVTVVVGASLLWRGADWWAAMTGIPQFYSVVNASLGAVLSRLGSPTWLTYLLWAGMLTATLFLSLLDRPALSREKSGLLLAASLLLAPYAAGNSLLTVLAIGVIPLLATPDREAETVSQQRIDRSQANNKTKQNRSRYPLQLWSTPTPRENIITAIIIILLINLAYVFTLLLPASTLYFQILVYHPTIMLLIIWGVFGIRQLRRWRAQGERT
jgi:hypothetical protein